MDVGVAKKIFAMRKVRLCRTRTLAATSTTLADISRGFRNRACSRVANPWPRTNSLNPGVRGLRQIGSLGSVSKCSEGPDRNKAGLRKETENKDVFKSLKSKAFHSFRRDENGRNRPEQPQTPNGGVCTTSIGKGSRFATSKARDRADAGAREHREDASPARVRPTP